MVEWSGVHRVHRRGFGRGLINFRNLALAKLSWSTYVPGMTTMSISLPATFKSFVDVQLASRGYETSSEYVRELVRKDQDRHRLRGSLVDGAVSVPASAVDKAYFDDLRDHMRWRTAG